MKLVPKFMQGSFRGVLTAIMEDERRKIGPGCLASELSLESFSSVASNVVA